MAIRFDIELKGDTELMDKFRRAPDMVPPRLGTALYIEAHRILSESQRIVPFETGTLSGSATVEPPYVTGRTVAVRLGYGGAARDYAEVQHEHTEFRHAAGRQAHYLLDPMENAAGTFATRLAAQVGRLFG